jgi:hypothetical protein
MYLTLFITTLILGLTYNILQTQNLISKNFKLVRLISGVLYATGLLVFLIHKEPNVSEFGIDALVVLNCLTAGSDSTKSWLLKSRKAKITNTDNYTKADLDVLKNELEKFIKKFSILLSIFIIIGMFIYLIAIS